MRLVSCELISISLKITFWKDVLGTQYFASNGLKQHFSPPVGSQYRYKFSVKILLDVRYVFQNVFLKVNMHACLCILYWQQVQYVHCFVAPRLDLSITNSTNSEPAWILEACIRLFALACCTYLCVCSGTVWICMCADQSDYVVKSRWDSSLWQQHPALLNSTCTHTLSRVSLTHLGEGLVGT